MKCTVFIFRLLNFYQHLRQVKIRKKWKTKYFPIFPIMFSFHTVVFTFDHWLEKENNHREVKKKQNPWLWQSWFQLNFASESLAEICKHRMEGDIFEVLYQLSSVKPWNFVFLTRFQVVLIMLVHGPHFENHRSRADIPDVLGKPLHKLST